MAFKKREQKQDMEIDFYCQNIPQSVLNNINSQCICCACLSLEILVACSLTSLTFFGQNLLWRKYEAFASSFFLFFSKKKYGISYSSCIWEVFSEQESFFDFNVAIQECYVALNLMMNVLARAAHELEARKREIACALLTYLHSRKLQPTLKLPTIVKKNSSFICRHIKIYLPSRKRFVFVDYNFYRNLFLYIWLVCCYCLYMSLLCRIFFLFHIHI